MPLTGDVAGLKRWQSAFAQLARPELVLNGIKPEVRATLKEEFATSTGPDGSTWAPTVRGRAALVSRKLPGAFALTVTDDALEGVGRVTRDWLRTQQEGKTFPQRQVADRAQVLRFSRKGRLLSAKRFEKAKYGYATQARAHTVGQRVLPARQMVPEGEGALPSRWQAAGDRGATTAIERWYERVG